MMCYLIVEASGYELPCVLLNTISDVARWLGVPYSTASDAVYNNSVVSKKYKIERVCI